VSRTTGAAHRPWLQIAALVLVFLEYSYVIRLRQLSILPAASRSALAGIGLLGTHDLLCRTLLEDKMLREELAGYKEYAAQVKYRLALGIW
jgi:protein-S-isoprenylcysteine O-methyltransferase Ste14